MNLSGSPLTFRSRERDKILAIRGQLIRGLHSGSRAQIDSACGEIDRVTEFSGHALGDASRQYGGAICRSCTVQHGACSIAGLGFFKLVVRDQAAKRSAGRERENADREQ